MKQQVFAFTGVAGTAVQDSLSRLKHRLGGEVLIISIDNLLWDLFTNDARKHPALRQETRLSDEELAPGSKPNWWKVLTLPKGCIRHYWRLAAGRALRKVKQSDADYVLLNFHARYQSDAYRWRFCPCDPVVLRRFSIRGFFTLIDDVYNVHRRRTVDLDSETQISLQHDDPWKRAESLVLQSIASMSDLIHWRQEEISTTEDLAAACDAPVHLLSIRHPLSTAVKLIKDPGFAYYFSHPITAIRKHPQFLQHEDLAELLNISKQLRERTTLIEPTTIDEYRVDALEQDGDKLFLPCLSPRWPYADTAEQLLGPPEANQLDAQREFLCPQETIEATELAGIFEELVQQRNGENVNKTRRAISDAIKRFTDLVSEDITWRDHALVDQCKRMIVFRPAYLGIPSNGVKRELEYQRKLIVSAPLSRAGEGNASRRVSFIYHPPSDEALLDKHIAEQVVNKWAADSGIGTHLRPALRPGSEAPLVTNLAKILSAEAEPSAAATRCAELMSGRVKPAVMDPMPMQRGKRSVVEDKNSEIRERLKSAAVEQIQTYRYLPALVASPSIGLRLMTDRLGLVGAVPARDPPVRTRSR